MGNAFAKRRKAGYELKRDQETRDGHDVDVIKDPIMDAVDGSVPHRAEEMKVECHPTEMEVECDPTEVKVECDPLEERDGDVDHINISLYEYPFENLVFEGGGTKGLAYCGAIQVLEELGIRPKIKRVAGTSAGAITAAMFAAGLSSAKIRDLMDVNMKTLMMDNRFGYLSLIPNMLRHFGWNPGHRFKSWLGEKLEEAGLSKTVTFKQLLKLRNVELCIVVSNVNLMTTEYFHAKTTPNMTVREAVCMSSAIPLLFQANCHDVHGTGFKDTYVDGGVFCNYPINCFDGWWLSMKDEDSFMEKFSDLNNLPRLFESSSRFGDYNDKTLGFLLYADKEKDLLRDTLERTRVGTGRGQIPDTKRGRKFTKEMKAKDERRKESDDLAKAFTALLNALKRHDGDANRVFSLEELRHALEDDELKQHTDLLFKEKGAAATAEDVMEAMDKDKDGQIEFMEIVAYFGRRGYSLRTRLLGHARRHVTSLHSFLVAIERALRHNVQRLNVHEHDVKRTVGINTGHVGTTHFDLEEADKDYVVNQGRKATEVFLKEYVRENNPPKKKPAVTTATDTKLGEEIRDAIAAPNGTVTHAVSTPIDAARKDTTDVSNADVLISNGKISNTSIAMHYTEAAVMSDVVVTGRTEYTNTSTGTNTPTAASDGIDHTVEKEGESVASSDNEAKLNAEYTVDKDTVSDGEETDRSGSLSDGVDTVSDSEKTDKSGSMSDGADTVSDGGKTDRSGSVSDGADTVSDGGKTDRSGSVSDGADTVSDGGKTDRSGSVSDGADTVSDSEKTDKSGSMSDGADTVSDGGKTDRSGSVSDGADTVSDGGKTDRSGSVSDGADTVSDGGKTDRSGSVSDGADTVSDGGKTDRSGSVSDGADTVSDGGKTDRSGSVSDGADKGYQSQ